MEEAARTLVIQLLKEGHSVDDVRRELVSQGFGSQGLYEELATLKKEAGVTDVRKQKKDPRPHFNPVLNDKAKEYADHYTGGVRSRMVRNALKLLGAVLVIVVAVIVFSGYGATLKDALFGAGGAGQGLKASDYAHESRMQTMQISADTYRSRLTDYGGVCSSIGIDRSVYVCNDSTAAYAIEVELSNGKFYCVDSTGFVGIIEESIRVETSCN